MKTSVVFTWAATLELAKMQPRIPVFRELFYLTPASVFVLNTIWLCAVSVVNRISSGVHIQTSTVRHFAVFPNRAGRRPRRACSDFAS